MPPVGRRRLSEAGVRDLRVRQGNLSAITEHHSWLVLLAEVQKAIDRIETSIVHQVLHSKEGLSLVDQAYLKGFVEGMDAFAKTPDIAAAKVERVMRQHGITTEGDAA